VALAVIKVGCVEEAAFRQSFISEEQLKTPAEPLKKSGYGKYLVKLR
jgi:glucose-1-phosphate thymidylyltransferase